jgi:hypothetical protein
VKPPTDRANVVRLPPPSIGVYRQDRLVAEGAASVFFICLSLVMLLALYGVMLAGGVG